MHRGGVLPAFRLHQAARAGHTLPELAIVVVIVAIACALAAGRWRALADRTGVRMAAADLASLLAEARDVALAGAQVVSARVEATDGSVTLRSGPDTIARRALAAHHGVHLDASRESVTYSPLGLGRGLANARFVLARGAAAETVWVSRWAGYAWGAANDAPAQCGAASSACRLPRMAKASRRRQPRRLAGQGPHSSTSTRVESPAPVA